MDNKLFYSVNSYLAWFISNIYYKDSHFVWCAPVFDPSALDANNPLKCIHETSSPKHIYEVFKTEVATKNILTCAKIQANKNGLLAGVSYKLANKLITPLEAATITTAINGAVIEHFRPRLYLIPVTDDIQKKLVKVPLINAANPLSTEYQIHDLKGDEFEIIEY